MMYLYRTASLFGIITSAKNCCACTPARLGVAAASASKCCSHGTQVFVLRSNTKSYTEPDVGGGIGNGKPAHGSELRTCRNEHVTHRVKRRQVQASSGLLQGIAHRCRSWPRINRLARKSPRKYLKFKSSLKADRTLLCKIDYDTMQTCKRRQC